MERRIVNNKIRGNHQKNAKAPRSAPRLILAGLLLPAAITWLIGAPGTATASSLSAFYFPDMCYPQSCPVSSSNQSATYSGSPTAGLNVNASVNMAPGVMKAAASYTASGSVGAYNSFYAEAQMFDVLTISAPLPFQKDQIGYIVPIYTLTGSATGDANGEIAMYYSDSFTPGIHQVQIFNPISAGTYSFGPIPFHFGEPIGLGTVLTMFLSLVDNGSGDADFSHTALLTGLAVYSDPGATQQVTTAIYGESQLGGTYSANGIVLSASPEPSSVLLLAPVLGLFVWLRRTSGVRQAITTCRKPGLYP